jgi:endonuclease I
MQNAKLILIGLFVLFGLTVGISQYDFTSVFPGLTGAELSDRLVESYKPASVLDFAEAKDVMYGEIYEQNDSVECVYTGHQLYLDPNADPSQYLYLNGSSNGINAEHNYPRSKGAQNGNALSDLYNLFPSRIQVNSDRGNLPFGESDDNQTTFWYYLDDKVSGIPGTMIDAYSEINGTLFEPREDHKGNVARSIFYFVTMYADEVQAADPAFFEQMRTTLCEWHYADPVDSLEWVRNQKIASYQSGKVNPFVLDCSLAGRLYCDWIDEACISVDVEDELMIDPGSHLVYPNPFSHKLNVETEIDHRLSGIHIYSLLGQDIFSVAESQLKKEFYKNQVYQLDLSVLTDGLYIIEFEYKLDNNSNYKEREIILKQNR